MNKAPIFANSRKIVKDLYEFLNTNIDKFGNSYRYKGLFNFYFINNPDEIKKVFLKSDSLYKRKTKYNQHVQYFTSKSSLFFAHNEEWREKRKQMNPFFAKKNVKKYQNLMIEKVSEIIQEINLKEHQSVDIYDISNNLVVQIIFDAFYGKKLDKKEFAKIMIWINELRDFLGQIPFPVISNPKTPTYRNLKIRKMQKKFNNFILEMLEERLEKTSDTDDLLDTIIGMYSTKNEQDEIILDKEAIVKEVYLTIFAGYETSSATIAWIFDLLAKNPDKYAKLQQEIDVSFKDKNMDPEIIMKLPYTDNVLNEVLRIQTAAWILIRQTTKDVEISGEKIAKDSHIVLCPHFAHHDKSYWEKPNEFIPERWSAENVHEINKDSFIPFGAGPRKCIGMEFSITEMKIIMVLMLSKFEFSIDPDFETNVKYGMTTYPEQGLKMILKTRS